MKKAYGRKHAHSGLKGMARNRELRWGQAQGTTLGSGPNSTGTLLETRSEHDWSLDTDVESPGWVFLLASLGNSIFPAFSTLIF